jgi:hypothetical protein
VLGVQLSAHARLPKPVVIHRGTTDWLRLTTTDAQRLLRQVTRLVADLPRDSTGDVVWQSGADELLVLTDQVTLGLTPGLVTIGIPVGCDQLVPARRRAPDARTAATKSRSAAKEHVTEIVTVPLGVGTTKQVRGLFVSAFDRPAGPDAVTGAWADALTAFAWEALLTLAQHLAAEAGQDGRGRPLVPGALAAEQGALLVKPMAPSEV